MKIKQFNSQNLKELRSSITNVLKQVGDEYGLKLEIGNISYDHNTFSTRLKAELNDPEIAIGKENRANMVLGQHGFKIGDQFIDKTKRFTIVGLNLRRFKKPVEIVDQNGRKFVAPIDYISRQIKLSK